MIASRTYTIQMTSEQKELFDRWLSEVEKDLEIRLESTKSLRRQMEIEDMKTIPLAKSTVRNPINQSWTSKTINALKQLGNAQTSAAIIAWLMNSDDGLQSKGKRYVTKNVTSKLSLLVDKGIVEKKIVERKNLYSLKNQG